MGAENLISRMIQVGTVSSVDKPGRRVRCILRETGHTSGWLYVLKSSPLIPDENLPQHTESQSGGDGEALFANHFHELKVNPWMPKVNDQVLIVYLPVDDGDGFVIGGI